MVVRMSRAAWSEVGGAVVVGAGAGVEVEVEVVVGIRGVAGTLGSLHRFGRRWPVGCTTCAPS